jgi:aminopeptidase YwaD
MFTHYELTASIETHLQALCTQIGSRPVGSAKNQKAQLYLARRLADAGLDVEQQMFYCLDWQPQEIRLTLAGQALAAQINPFSPACNVTASYVLAGNLDELAAQDFTGKIVVLHGDLSKEPLMPKNFTFYNPEEHQQIIKLLETKQPKAILAVSPKDSNPAPIIGDGDFRIPSATVPATTGKTLLEQQGHPLTLQIQSTNRLSAGANVIGRQNGDNPKKIVLCAHYDTKPGTPGAIDNASGVAAVLALAQLVKTMIFPFDLELIAFNGEDYYSIPGQMMYLQRYASEFPRIALVINIDGVGAKDQNTSVALFACPEQLEQQIVAIQANYPGIIRVEPWPQGDHSLFATQGVPSVAFSSTGAQALLETVIHTAQDTLEGIAPEKIAEMAFFVRDLITELSSQ